MSQVLDFAMPVKSVQKTANRKQRKKLEDSERARICLARFAPLQYGGGLEPIANLSKTYDRDPAVISRAISDAFKRCLVEVRPAVATSVQLARSLALEERLRAKYRNLLGVVVIRTDPPPGPEHLPDAKTWNDNLHAKLGAAMADVIASGTVFRPGDRVGVGPGRAVFQTVESLRQLGTKLPIGDIELFSLTGAMHVGAHGVGTNLLMDADTNLNLFSECFAGPVKTNFVHSPIVVGTDEEDVLTYKRATWLQGNRSGTNNVKGSGVGISHSSEDSSSPNATGEKRETQALTHAVVGVGAFSWGHRLYQEGKARDPEYAHELPPPDHMFDIIGEDLVRLARLCDKCTSQLCAPVGDICNNLFLTPAPARTNAGEAKRIQDLVANIKQRVGPLKKRLITISEAQLARIGTIILIAGGPKKVGSTRVLLGDQDDPIRRSPAYNIRFLCTDEMTARELLT
jgi:DNA-binding transcriptional regulator LsrR (DeoR family)